MSDRESERIRGSRSGGDQERDEKNQPDRRVTGAPCDWRTSCCCCSSCCWNWSCCSAVRRRRRLPVSRHPERSRRTCPPPPTDCRTGCCCCYDQHRHPIHDQRPDRHWILLWTERRDRRCCGCSMIPILNPGSRCSPRHSDHSQSRTRSSHPDPRQRQSRPMRPTAWVPGLRSGRGRVWRTRLRMPARREPGSEAGVVVVAVTVAAGTAGDGATGERMRDGRHRRRCRACGGAGDGDFQWKESMCCSFPDAAGGDDGEDGDCAACLPADSPHPPPRHHPDPGSRSPSGSWCSWSYSWSSWQSWAERTVVVAVLVAVLVAAAASAPPHPHTCLPA